MNAAIAADNTTYPASSTRTLIRIFAQRCCGRAACTLVRDHGVQHIDMNFGCPAAKVVKKGGGAALLGDLERARGIVEGVVEAKRMGDVVVTAKMRAGYAGELTYIKAGCMLQQAGVDAITLHARTAEALYERGEGRRNWDRIAALVREVDIPVWGNGDIFTARDAVDMMEQTHCKGVVVGRGCLGRPWLFRDIADALVNGVVQVSVPAFGEVRKVMKGHLEGVVAECVGKGWSEERGVRYVRRWYGWYLQGALGVDGLVGRLCAAEKWCDVVRVLDAVDETRVAWDVDAVVRERGKLGRE